MYVLAAAAVLLGALDNWTTYLCLHEPVPGFVVEEANPIGAALFQAVGLVPGLWVDLAVTVLAALFLVRSTLWPRAARAGLLGLIAASSAFGVRNNLDALWTLGLL